MGRSPAHQKVHATRRAVWSVAPSAPSPLGAARERSASASNRRALASRGGNLQLSFQAAPETSLHRAKAWDRGVLSARCDDASKLPQWLADKLRALRTSAFFGKPSLPLRDGRRPAVCCSTSNPQRLCKGGEELKHADQRSE